MCSSDLGHHGAAIEVENAVANDLLNRGDKKRGTVEIGDALTEAVR